MSDAGADCYDGLRTIDSSISAEDGGWFSCTVNGGILPNHVQLESFPGQATGAASSFEPELANGTYSIMLVVTDASGRTS